ncbi:MAG TPA: hypothetical protein VEJ36_05895 [Nitrososphaerales archaeon]|nr:hypothetical protein [Nitrososphaerales archaeon]
MKESEVNAHSSSRIGRNLTYPVHGLTLISLAVITSFFAYLWGAASPNPANLLAPALFWYSASFLLLAYPFRDAFAAFTKYVKTALGASVFIGYLTIHILLYGFMLESILVSVFDAPFVSGSASVYVTTSVFAPPNLLNAVVSLWFNPWITITIPPFFGDAVSFYSLAVAVIIAMLIVANIGKTRELGSICSTSLKSRSVVIFPALGIAFGASCCLSVPLLFTIAAPAGAALSSFLWLYDLTYFLFPPIAVVLLYLNLYSIKRITASAELQSNSAPPTARPPEET